MREKLKFLLPDNYLTR